MGEVIYTKYSNDRARRFALRTDILCENGTRRVRKKAVWPEGMAHVAGLARWYRELDARYHGSGLAINACRLEEGEAYLEYLEGPTLEQSLDGCLERGALAEAENTISAWLAEVKKGFRFENFYMTSRFQEVFGPVHLPEDLCSGDVVDIDMLFGNVIVGQGWTLIDYEWTFDFPVPYHFVVYRILDYYFRGSSSRSGLSEQKLLEKAGLTPEEIDIYERMERHFQDVYLLSEDRDGGRYTPLRLLYDEISPGSVCLKELGIDESDEKQARMVQLYQSADMNFTEENSQKKLPMMEGSFIDSFPVASESRYTRLDPAACYCEIHKLQIRWGAEITRYRTNGIPLEDGGILFPIDDPQIIIERPEENDEPLRTYFEIEYLSAQEALYRAHRAAGQLRSRLDESEQKVRLLEEKIRQMENTKVWKAYRKIKRS